MTGLSHINERGEATMVDIASKSPTARTATAEGFVRMSTATLDLVANQKVPKGDVFAVARIAGIMAAKQTHTLIPLCHPLPISSVSVDFEILRGYDCIRVVATTKTIGQTGVEMEALMAVSIACLTLYDMLKAADKSIRFDGMRLLTKTGGASGDYHASFQGQAMPWG